MFILKLSGLLIDSLDVSPENVVKAIGMIFFYRNKKYFYNYKFSSRFINQYSLESMGMQEYY